MTLNRSSNNPMQETYYVFDDVKADIVHNKLEATKYVYLQALSKNYSLLQRQEIYQALLDQLKTKNGKYYIVPAPEQTKEFLDYLNEKNPNYTTNIVNKTNSLYADLNKTNKLKSLPNDFKIHSLATIESDEDKIRCEKTSEFQQKELVAMRKSVVSEQVLLKLKERYSVAALLLKSQTENIIVYTAERKVEQNQKQIAASLVLNMHAPDGDNQIIRNAYVSDLFIGEEHRKQEDFTPQFMASVLQKVHDQFPNLQSIVFMSGGNREDVLAKCIEMARQAGVCETLDISAQAKLGVITYFVYEPTQDKNNEKYITKENRSMLATASNMFQKISPKKCDVELEPTNSFRNLSSR